MTVNISPLRDDTQINSANWPDFVRSASADDSLEDVALAIARSKRIVVVCGAGISVASGIPDFRSSEGLFRTLKDENPKELLSSGKDLFDSSVFNVPERTALFYKMIAQLASLSASATPTPFHQFLKALDERGQLLRLYTQNIDNLEEKAGLSCGIPTWSKQAASTAQPSQPSKTATPQVSEFDSVSVGPETATVPTIDALALTPRCIPLHGTLKVLVCQRCSHSIPLETKLDILADGHSVQCPQCESNSSARRLEGKRDRGVGRMRPSVVLYGEEHLNGEGVGECVRRDLIGLGDVASLITPPLAPQATSAVSAASSSVPPVVKTPSPRAKVSAKPDLLIVAGTSLKVPGTKRIVREFAKAVQSTSLSKAPNSTVNGTGNQTSAAGSNASNSRAPSPAMTSTSASSPGKSRKRKRETDGAERDGALSETTLLNREHPNSGSSGSIRSSPSTDVDTSTLQNSAPPSTAPSLSTLKDSPPRTIYLNFDFPVPTRDWKGVFDAWVQGDVQDAIAVFERVLKERHSKEVSQPKSRRRGKKRNNADTGADLERTQTREENQKNDKASTKRKKKSETTEHNLLTMKGAGFVKVKKTKAESEPGQSTKVNSANIEPTLPTSNLQESNAEHSLSPSPARQTRSRRSSLMLGTSAIRDGTPNSPKVPTRRRTRSTSFSTSLVKREDDMNDSPEMEAAHSLLALSNSGSSTGMMTRSRKASISRPSPQPHSLQHSQSPRNCEAAELEYRIEHSSLTPSGVAPLDACLPPTKGKVRRTPISRSLVGQTNGNLASEANDGASALFHRVSLGLRAS